MGLLQWLGISGSASPTPKPALDTLIAALEEMGDEAPDQAHYLAAFAWLLARVARADGRISRVEVKQMREIIAEQAGLTPQQSAIVVSIARVDHGEVTAAEDAAVLEAFNALANAERREALIRAMFAVAAADAIIHPVEEAAIHRVAAELSLDPVQVEDIRKLYTPYIKPIGA